MIRLYVRMVSEPERDSLEAWEGVSFRLQDRFDELFAAHQQLTAQLMRVVHEMHETADVADTEFVGDVIALLMNCHPETGRTQMAKSVLACGIPGLLAAMEAGELTERHVHAAADELHRCLADDELRAQVLRHVLTQCRARVARGRRFPFPSELRRMIRKQALQLDLDAAERREEKTRQDRCVLDTMLPDGAVNLGITGPAVQCAAMRAAIEAHAKEIRQLGDERTWDQLRFDAAFALLTGQQPDPSGAPVLPGGHCQVIVPISTAQGCDLELGELIGYGPLLPSTARALLGQAATISRVCIDAVTGQVISVDKPRPHTDGTTLDATLEAMRTDPPPEPSTPTSSAPGGAYRPSPKTDRLVKARDLTCRFPGCRKVAADCDVDHRIPWPRGATDPANLQALCRHHHRAKQSGLFTISAKPDGTITWTTRRGHTFESPPPEW